MKISQLWSTIYVYQFGVTCWIHWYGLSGSTDLDPKIVGITLFDHRKNYYLLCATPCPLSSEYLSTGQYVDISLVCKGQVLRAHKVTSSHPCVASFTTAFTGCPFLLQ